MNKPKMHSPNLTHDHIARIRACFPNCVTEAQGKDGHVKLAVDFDLLRQELSESIVEGPQERYQLNWPGKRQALLTANAPIAKTLRPCREESVDFDTTQNLFIEGDNLDALKLLQETYLGKVKMIYIDPPYNTGNDFIYEDDFAEDMQSYQLRSHQKDEQGKRLQVNTESNGRFHSDWLSMMYSRLKLARNLLREDGVIFISIDDHEQANLKRLCDEVFGEENFLANIVWQKKYAATNDAKGFSNLHDHILVFQKSNSFERRLLPRTEEQNKPYKNDNGDGKGLWRSDNLLVKSFSQSGVYPIINPNTRVGYLPPEGSSWRASKETMQKWLEENRIYFGKDGTGAPQLKRYLNEVQDGRVPTTWWTFEDAGHNDAANKELSNLFKSKTPFDTPKPSSLIRQMLRISTKTNDTILDFFSGSATTAHAVMQLNAEDGGNRKFIMVQIPEPCDEKSEAFKAGFKTIAQIGQERIRRAGQKIKTEYANKESIAKLDIGFRVLKIDTSNMADIYYRPDQTQQPDLINLVNNIKPDRTAEDLLFQVLLDWGVDLALPIAQETIQGKEVFLVDGNALAACFDAQGGVDGPFVKELAKRQPLRAVFRDAGFKNDATKINVEQIFKLLSPATEVKCI
ncbi:MAG: site-specific DNA-methyltransferase [Gammaproteobacteria bacterium]|nr:site-specific DNA-methyltransferase [Gammaproteobacteria bacterium]